MDTIHERSSYRGEPAALPSADDLRTLLVGKQYFDNDYRPSDFLHCLCHRLDCPSCTPPHDPPNRALHDGGL